MELGNVLFGHSRGSIGIPRGKGFEDELIRLFEACDPQRDKSWREYGVPFENEIFEVHPYCWCEEETCPQCGTGEQFNFFYKPTRFGIRWYKYPLRDAYATEKITLIKFHKIIDVCIGSVKAGKK